MTLEQLERMEGDFLKVADVAEYLCKRTDTIHQSIRNGVPWAYVIGNSTYMIPKRAFVNYHRYGGMIITQKKGA